jgi:PAS domain S-box-containing protein/putative nucleotidyltransferase with HDIG domain
LNAKKKTPKQPRKRAAKPQAPHESETLYRTLAEAARDMIFIIDRQGVALYTNSFGANLFGRPAEEIIGRRVHDILDPDLFKHQKDIIARVFETGAPLHTSNQVRFQGREVWLDNSMVPLRDASGEVFAVMGIARDATARHQAEEVLRESEGKYRILVEQSLQGVVIAQGPPLRLIFANPALAAILGYSTEELISFTPEQTRGLVHPEDRGLFFQRFQDRLAGKAVPPHYEFRAVRRDESVRWVEIFSNRIVYRGEPAVQAVFLDITDRKRAEEDIQKNLRKLRQALRETIQAIALIIETKDPYTAGHQRRSTQLAEAIARELGLPEEQCEGIRMAGFIHDLGKIAVPSEILSKPNPLNEIERAIIQNHVRAGYEILKTVEFPWPVAQVVLQHHERLDGSGYPSGLTGEGILLEARILAVADVVEAMASYRPYRPARGIKEAFQEIAQGRDRLYDPQVVDACLKLFSEKGFSFEPKEGKG